jgi:hypothetical protein
MVTRGKRLNISASRSPSEISLVDLAPLHRSHRSSESLCSTAGAEAMSMRVNEISAGSIWFRGHVIRAECRPYVLTGGSRDQAHSCTPLVLTVSTVYVHQMIAQKGVEAVEVGMALES